MSDTTETDTNTDTTDEPTKAELHERVEQLESTVEKLMPSRRDALKLGAAGLAGAAGLGVATQPADAATGSAGDIGSPNNRPDIFADTVDANSVTGAGSVADRQGCRVFLSSQQSISAGTADKIQFDSKSYDSDNNFSTTSHDWTCPEDGIYVATVQCDFRGGSSGDDRTAFIGTAVTETPSDEGSRTQRVSSDPQARIQATTINKYSSGDTIAAYAQNKNSTDALGATDGAFATFLEVAFLGGL